MQDRLRKFWYFLLSFLQNAGRGEGLFFHMFCSFFSFGKRVVLFFLFFQEKKRKNQRKETLTG